MFCIEFACQSKNSGHSQFRAELQLMRRLRCCFLAIATQHHATHLFFFCATCTAVFFELFNWIGDAPSSNIISTIFASPSSAAWWSGFVEVAPKILQPTRLGSSKLSLLKPCRAQKDLIAS